ncbi:MAG: DinB family protein [Bacteroidetes bacterium]|nr:MAG: DinB family protein [Bacteroidota bacterium]
MLTTDHYYNNYINVVKDFPLPMALQQGHDRYRELFDELTEEQWGHRYAPGKWSIKEVVQHVIDAERIFTYRALCFARGEQQNLPPFEEDDYVANSRADARTGKQIAEEFSLVRQSTIALFSSFDAIALVSEGVANSTQVSVTEIGYIQAGHSLHHLKVIRERYL